MKRRFLDILSVTLVLALCLAGCGGSNGSISTAGQAVNSSAMSYGGASAAPETPAYDYGIAEDMYDGEAEGDAYASASDDGALSAPLDARKIIRHAYMDLETMEFESALAGIQQTVTGSGGYIESQSQGGGTSYASRGRYQEERYANLQARVPSEKLDEVVSSVGGLCNVLSQSESMDDITDSYYDSQARLSTLQIQEERLLAILEKAEKLEDVITLESALSDVRYQIERLTASIRRMDSQVAYSYLNISLQEVVEYQQVQEKPRTFAERMSEAAGDGVESMVAGLQDFSLTAARVGPSLLVWLVILGAVVLLIRAIARANAKRREAKGLPPKRPPLTYTTGPSGHPQYERYPKNPPPPAAEEPSKGDGEQSQ